MPNPSGALIKAVLMNGAQFLQGVDNGGNGVTEISPYDNNQNFGRLSLQGDVFYHECYSAAFVVEDELLLAKPNVYHSIFRSSLVQTRYIYPVRPKFSSQPLTGNG